MSVYCISIAPFPLKTKTKQQLSTCMLSIFPFHAFSKHNPIYSCHLLCVKILWRIGPISKKSELWCQFQDWLSQHLLYSHPIKKRIILKKKDKQWLHAIEIWFNPIPTGQGRNPPLYEHHVTKSGRNRVNKQHNIF